MMVLTLLLASTPAVASQQVQNPAAVAAPAAVPAKKEKKICRDDPAFTGSRITKQLCLTKAQWKSREAAQAGEGASN